MSADLASLPARTPPTAMGRARRSTTDRLRAALAPLHAHHGQILTHRETPWASITFAGSRHALALLFAGEDAVAAGEAFLEVLPEHEFAIPGQLVADAAITAVDHRLLPSPRLVVECELLLLEDA